ncbi:MAG: hypothetical protein ABWJ99_04460 [Caldimicrobium sp.]
MGLIPPMEKRSGFVYFKIDEKANNLANMKVLVKVKEKDAFQTVEIPLKGTLIASQEEKSEQ